MRFPVSLDTQNLFSILSEFIAITGWDAWEKRRAELSRQLSENSLLTDLFRERHRLELGLFRLADERRRARKSPKLIRDPLEYQIAAFMATTVGFNQRLNRAAKARLAGRLRDGMQSDVALNALCHEMTTATHFLQQGFDVEPSDLMRGGGFDFLIANGALEAEVECKLATSDIGRQIHRRHMLTLSRAVQSKLLELRGSLEGGFFLNVVLAERLTADHVLHRRISEAVTTALRDQQTVCTGDFKVFIQSFDFTSSPFSKKRCTNIQANELSAFIHARFGKPNAHAMAHVTPRRLAIVFCIESAKRDRVAKGIYKQLRDGVMSQFSRTRPGILAVRLADLGDDGLMRLAGNQGQQPNALQAIATQLLDNKEREFLDTIAFLGSGTVTRRTTTDKGNRTTVISQSGHCYIFRGTKANQACNFFRAE